MGTIDLWGYVRSIHSCRGVRRYVCRDEVELGVQDARSSLLGHQEAIIPLAHETLFTCHQGQSYWRHEWLGWFAKDVEEGNCHFSLSWLIVES
jgi:hypothetical protein